MEANVGLSLAYIWHHNVRWQSHLLNDLTKQLGNYTTTKIWLHYGLRFIITYIYQLNFHDDSLPVTELYVWSCRHSILLFHWMGHWISHNHAVVSSLCTTFLLLRVISPLPRSVRNYFFSYFPLAQLAWRYWGKKQNNKNPENCVMGMQNEMKFARYIWRMFKNVLKIL